MKDRGIGTTADVLFLALAVSVSCLILIGSPLARDRNKHPDYASRVAQNTLLTFQNLPVGTFENFSYTPNIPVENPSKRTFEEKTVSQLIAEDVLLNPRWVEGDRLVSFRTNYGYSKKLDNLLETLLTRFVGERFGFRLTIRMQPIRIPENRLISYRKSIGNFEENSRKLCSETIRLDLVLPWDQRKEDHEGKQDESRESKANLSRLLTLDFLKVQLGELLDPFSSQIGRVGTLNLTLELWSR